MYHLRPAAIVRSTCALSAGRSLPAAPLQHYCQCLRSSLDASLRRHEVSAVASDSHCALRANCSSAIHSDGCIQLILVPALVYQLSNISNVLSLLLFLLFHASLYHFRLLPQPHLVLPSFLLVLPVPQPVPARPSAGPSRHEEGRWQREEQQRLHRQTPRPQILRRLPRPSRPHPRTSTRPTYPSRPRRNDGPRRDADGSA